MFQRAEKNDDDESERARQREACCTNTEGASSSRTVSDVRVFVPPMYTTQGRASAHKAWIPRPYSAERGHSARGAREKTKNAERTGSTEAGAPPLRGNSRFLPQRAKRDRSADQDRRCLAAESHLRLQSRGGAKRRSSQEKERQRPQPELCEGGEWCCGRHHFRGLAGPLLSAR